MPISIQLRAAAVVAAAAAVVPLSACSGFSGGTATGAEDAASGPGSAAQTITLTDAAGQEHSFDGPVERIACQWYGCNSMLGDLGLAPAMT